MSSKRESKFKTNAIALLVLALSVPVPPLRSIELVNPDIEILDPYVVTVELSNGRDGDKEEAVVSLT